MGISIPLLVRFISNRIKIDVTYFNGILTGTITNNSDRIIFIENCKIKREDNFLRVINVNFYNSDGIMNNKLKGNGETLSFNNCSFLTSYKGEVLSSNNGNNKIRKIYFCFTNGKKKHPKVKILKKNINAERKEKMVKYG